MGSGHLRIPSVQVSDRIPPMPSKDQDDGDKVEIGLSKRGGNNCVGPPLPARIKIGSCHQVKDKIFRLVIYFLDRSHILSRPYNHKIPYFLRWMNHLLFTKNDRRGMPMNFVF